MLRLKGEGWSQRSIAEALAVREETVSRWLAGVRRDGPDSLRAHPAAGPRSKLSADQRRRVPELLWHGAEAYGFRGQVWTRARIAQVVQEEFGVRYHPAHVGRLLKDLRWTPQTPIRRAVQRDEAAIKNWRIHTWPRLKAEARKERRKLVFVDESGFYLLPGVVRTYAPMGETPVIRERVSRDHLSVIGGLTPAGRVYTLVRQEPLNGLHCIEFLIHLRRMIDGRMLVIWDGSPIHRRAAVTEHIAGTHGGVRIETLPGYAPDLNPWDEGGWNHLKHVQMRNLVSRDLEELHERFHLAVARLRRRPQIVQAFFKQAGLTLNKT